MATYDVVVVGGGVMGSATARALARRGRSVLLLEQFTVGHKRGSSHGAARIFRYSYPDPRYVAMAMETLPLWRQLESDYGRPLLSTTGGLDTGKGLGDHVDALEKSGAVYEVLDTADVARRFGAPELADGDAALFQPDAGVISAEEAWSAFVSLAEALGVEVRQGARVSEVVPRANGVAVRVRGSEFDAGTVVVTAGAWAKPLLAATGISLEVRPTRETVAYFDLPEPPPPTLVEWGIPPIYALFDLRRGIKAGEHEAGPTTDPNEDGSVNDASLARVAAWVRERFPRANPSPVAAETCLYTNTPDDHFVLERHDRVVVGSPCSGHGFKFAPLIGERLADLADEIVS